MTDYEKHLIRAKSRDKKAGDDLETLIREAQELAHMTHRGLTLSDAGGKKKREWIDEVHDYAWALANKTTAIKQAIIQQQATRNAVRMVERWIVEEAKRHGQDTTTLEAAIKAEDGEGTK